MRGKLFEEFDATVRTPDEPGSIFSSAVGAVHDSVS
jgi:hypothetical protein